MGPFLMKGDNGQDGWRHESDYGAGDGQVMDAESVWIGWDGQEHNSEDDGWHGQRWEGGPNRMPGNASARKKKDFGSNRRGPKQ